MMDENELNNRTPEAPETAEEGTMSEEKAPDTAPTNPSGPSGDQPTSPQTGADMTLTYVGIAVFLVAGAVALVAKKKSA